MRFLSLIAAASLVTLLSAANARADELTDWIHAQAKAHQAFLEKASSEPAAPSGQLWRSRTAAVQARRKLKSGMRS